jgi:hypothetical protein
MNAAAIAAAYREAMTRAPRALVRLRRYVKNDEGLFAAATSSPLPAMLTAHAEETVAGLVGQGASLAILLAEDVAGLTMERPPSDDEDETPDAPEPWFSDPPLRKTDKLVLADGSELAVEEVDTRTRRFAGVLIAYQVKVQG